MSSSITGGMLSLSPGTLGTSGSTGGSTGCVDEPFDPVLLLEPPFAIYFNVPISLLTPYNVHIELDTISEK